MRRSVAFGYYDQNLIAVSERLWDHVETPPAHQPRQRMWWVRARQVILATGAIERPLVFANNDLPGVMLASAAQGYAHRYAVQSGKAAVVFANNDDAYRSAAQLQRAGVVIHAIVDARADGPGESARALVPPSTELLTGHVVTCAQGRRAVKGATVMRYDAAANVVLGNARNIDCDLLCMSGGFNPTVHLFSQSQGKLR